MNRKTTGLCNTMVVMLMVAVLALITGLPALTWGNDKQGKDWHICVTKIVTHPALDACEKGFEAGLASAGFKKDVNVIYDSQNAEGEMSRADTISQLFAEKDCDLIHSITTPSTQSVLKFVNKTPIVFSAVTDPEAAGIVPSDSVPGSKTGTNITGVSDKWPVDLQMQAYARFVPMAKTWGTIYNPAEDNSVSHVSEMQTALKSLDMQLIKVHAANEAEVEAAARSLVGKVQAIAITADNTSVACFDVISRVCNENQIPLFAGDVDSVAKGAIAAYGPDYYLIGYSAGKKAALILKGVKPGDIPWGPMEKFSLVINQQAAALQGVVIDPDLVRIADKIVN